PPEGGHYNWSVSRAAAGLCLILSVSCARAASSPASHLVERTHQTMGTEVKITAWTADQSRADVAMSAVFSEFDRLDGLMSVWKSGSDIARLNSAAGERAVPVSVETREVLRIARQISEQTGGTFDITFAALSGLWKFDYQDKDGTVPDRQEIAKRPPLVHYRDLVVGEGVGTALLRRKGMRGNLGGIGTGHGGDCGIDNQRGGGVLCVTSRHRVG